MRNYDDKVLNAFLNKQEQLFDERVAETLEEADDFLTEVLAVVADTKEDVVEYFEEEGLDMQTEEGEDIFEANEVFEVGDGRYLIVQG
ncbi:MAG: glyoxalase [Lachnospiraceae bacterium]|nr:glyoxalase [Lachnospiraceae bacterium]